MIKSTTPFLMFEGKAEEAIRFYVSVFGGSIDSIERYGPDGPGAEGSVVQARFTLNGQSFLCIDSPVAHGFSFTPSVSLFVTCEQEAEVDAVFGKLAEEGEVLMPLDSYPFSRRYGWLNDRFGVSWQVSVETEVRSRATS